MVLHLSMASFIIYFPNSIIILELSAIGINSAGETTPNSSLFHLTKHSKPSILSSLLLTLGCITKYNSLFFIAFLKPFSIKYCLFIELSMSILKYLYVFLPSFLALYIATSTLFNKVSKSSPSLGYNATPMLIVV
ncbi:hypothetical protein D3C76_971350 [compost metagenome]